MTQQETRLAISTWVMMSPSMSTRLWICKGNHYSGQEQLPDSYRLTVDVVGQTSAIGINLIGTIPMLT